MLHSMPSVAANVRLPLNDSVHTAGGGDEGARFDFIGPLITIYNHLTNKDVKSARAAVHTPQMLFTNTVALSQFFMPGQFREPWPQEPKKKETEVIILRHECDEAGLGLAAIKINGLESSKHTELWKVCSSGASEWPPWLQQNHQLPTQCQIVVDAVLQGSSSDV